MCSHDHVGLRWRHHVAKLCCNHIFDHCEGTRHDIRLRPELSRPGLSLCLERQGILMRRLSLALERHGSNMRRLSLVLEFQGTLMRPVQALAQNLGRSHRNHDPFV